MPLSRRRFLTRSLALAGSLPLLGCGSDTAQPSGLPVSLSPSPASSSVPPFPQPQVRASRDGLLDTSLNVRYASHTVGGRPFVARSYEGGLPGPTLRFRPGDVVRVALINGLPPDSGGRPADVNVPHEFNSTNLHVHGVHVSPEGNSDNVFLDIAPGSAFPYEFRIPANHPPGTYWYHPHRHGASSTQLFSGMAGALIIEGDIDKVPEIAAARDVVYLINELNINSQNEVPLFGPTRPDDFMLDGPFPMTQRVLTVNGQVQPKLTIRPGEVVRLRVINAAVRTHVPFVVEGHDLNVIALDGISLSAARVEPVSLAPADRADVLVRGGQPGIYRILKGPIDGMEPDPEVALGLLEVAGEAVSMDLPRALPAPFAPIADSEVTRRRLLVFDNQPAGGPPGFPNFTINGARFNPDVVNQTIALNAVEEWTLRNDSTHQHPFHLHVNPFQVISMNGMSPPVPEFHDTIHLEPGATIVIRSRFTDFKGKFVFHCHLVVHQDLGMMQVVEVV